MYCRFVILGIVPISGQVCKLDLQEHSQRRSESSQHIFHHHICHVAQNSKPGLQACFGMMIFLYRKV